MTVGTNIQGFTSGEWTAAQVGGLDESELETLLGLGSSDITNFNYIQAEGSWTFDIDGITFKITSTGELKYEMEANVWSTIPGAGINVANADTAATGNTDGLSEDEVTLFNNFLDNQAAASDDANGSNSYQYRPRTLYQKMLYTISSQMNKMFLDILSMSTVLANGTGWGGINLLAEKGVTIDGVSITSMLADPVASIALTQYGGMLDNNVDILSITDLEGNPLESGEQDAIRVNFVGGGHTDLVLTDTAFSFMLSVPEDDGDWSIDCLDIKITESESILESPGTLFLVQQLLQMMKDALQAIGAVGKVGGDVRTTAIQSFVRDMNG